MQKMITITIDTKALSAQSQETFSINEVGQVNDLLAEGWYMEGWEFLNEIPDEDGKVTIIAILNDDETLAPDEETGEIYEEETEEK